MQFKEIDIINLHLFNLLIHQHSTISIKYHLKQIFKIENLMKTKIYQRAAITAYLNNLFPLMILKLYSKKIASPR